MLDTADNFADYGVETAYFGKVHCIITRRKAVCFSSETELTTFIAAPNIDFVISSVAIDGFFQIFFNFCPLNFQIFLLLLGDQARTGRVRPCVSTLLILQLVSILVVFQVIHECAGHLAIHLRLRVILSGCEAWRLRTSSDSYRLEPAVGLNVVGGLTRNLEKLALFVRVGLD